MSVRRLHPQQSWRLVVSFQADDLDARRASRAVKQLLQAGYGRVEAYTYEAGFFEAMLKPPASRPHQ